MATREPVRIGELSERLGIPIKTLRRLADAGRIPSERSPGGHRMFDPHAVASSLSGALPQPEIVPARTPDWRGSRSLDGLDEALVWGAAADALHLDRYEEGVRIATYAFTEMLNNAIDHSGGTTSEVAVWSSPQEIAFRVADDGRGAFAHLRAGLALERDLDAAAELTKGKRTTWSERHTGEGIFFTSKAVGVFRISANGFRLTIDNERGDVALGISTVRTGTMVEASIPIPPPRTLRAVFAEFADDDRGFSRSRPTVKLFGSGVTFVSRSEARRLMEGMEPFADIDIDFGGVEDVGQGFVDEIMRVWPSQHPGVGLHPINMNEAVEFMVRRAARRLDG